LSLPAIASRTMVRIIRTSKNYHTKASTNIYGASRIIWGSPGRKVIRMSTTIHQANTFKARPKRIYDILMSSREHAAMTANGSAKVSCKEGGAFYCHGGWIGGRNVELVPGKRIVQAWRAKNWPKGTYSLVTFTLKKQGRGTRLILDHTGIPDNHRGHLNSGWKARYWAPLRAYLAKHG
jgi:activator of HSP90 ATPase